MQQTEAMGRRTSDLAALSIVALSGPGNPIAISYDLIIKYLDTLCRATFEDNLESAASAICCGHTVCYGNK